MPRFCFVLAFITGLLLPALVQAETAVWNEQSERLELSRFVDYRVESSPISFSRLQALPEAEWQQNGSDSVSLGYGGDVYWFRVSGEVLRVTVSIGVCSATPARADATKEIFTCADDALYQAKNLGRNRVASDPHKCQSISATALS